MIFMDQTELPIEGKLPTRWEIYYFTIMGNFYYWIRMRGNRKKGKTHDGEEIHDFQKAEIKFIEDIPGDDVTKNTEIRKHLSETPLNHEIFGMAKQGTPLIKLGNGCPRVMIIAGVHGNELPPQIAALNLINELNGTGLNGTVYVVPFTAPQASAQNSKLFEGENLNLVADTPGSATNTILNVAQKLKIDSLADFHATSTHPAKDAVIYYLSIASSRMAVFVNKESNSELMALIYNPGTLIAACNDNDIPSILCEVESPDGVATQESIDVACKQMKAFLEFHRII